ncbi:NACHT domain-containing protein [Streptomyces sp. NPDC058001]|uniref:NACHT domain-containing protein n=1 Tax=Streptomyces sp. NPDC058001 TaxID=3346300 RepID=UPI0036E2EDCA
MDPAVLGTRLASSAISPLVKKLFVAEGPGAGLVDRPIRLSSYVSFRGERRTLTDQDVRKLAGRLVDRAVGSPGERPFPADEETAVGDALARTLLGLGDLDMDDVQAVRLGHRELARTLLAHSLGSGSDPASGLSADASVFLASAVEWACLHILHFFTQRSTFVARTLVEQSRSQAELIAKLDELITRMPRRDARDASFERRYGTYLTGRHGKLMIYGIDLTDSPGAWPLDVAYLSLEVTGWLDRPPHPDPTIPLKHGGIVWSPSPRPADQILAAHDKVLLRGVAGSGKTTLVQWLAVSATRAAPDGPLAYLHGLVPFVLPLRTLIRHGERLPGPERFLEAADSPLGGAQPDGWADRVLGARRGLVLVDGMDEIPDTERERTRAWLQGLITAYPGNRWLVTSRPSAVRENWLADDGFTELTLSPMSPTDVTAFIHRWHDAARTGAPDDGGLLDTYERQLLTAVRTKADLGRLATNPLMCGLICALHRDRRGYLPHGRKELYEAALAMLLTRRDRERDLTATGVGLRQEPQMQLLQRLAYWLIRNGRTELDRTHAERIIGDALPSVPEAAALGDAATVFSHLLLRSGLLREPAPGAVDFVHRTFQDYLGARAAVEVWDIGLLTDHAADDQWEDVIRMAVAHGRPRERAEILEGLLTAGIDADRLVQQRVFLLAAACLEHATELDPGVREQVEFHVGVFVPPVSEQAARDLASVGPLALDLLPPPDNLTDEEARLTVVAASHVDSEAAIPYLARFARHPSLKVRSQLVWAWSRFDTERYAEEVIGELDPEGLHFTVRDEAQLRALEDMGGRPEIQFKGPFETDHIAVHVGRFAPTNLLITDNEYPVDLDFLRGADSVIEVALLHCKNLLDLSAPTGLAPRGIFLDEAHLVTRGLDSWRELRRLTLDALTDLDSDDGWSVLADLPHLSHLAMSVDSCTEIPASLRLPGLRTLYLNDFTDATEAVDLSRIPNHFPFLTTLQINGTHTTRSRLRGIPPNATLQA